MSGNLLPSLFTKSLAICLRQPTYYNPNFDVILSGKYCVIQFLENIYRDLGYYSTLVRVFHDAKSLIVKDTL